MLDIFGNPWLLVSLSAFLLIGAGICRQVRPEWGYWPMVVAALAAGLGFGLDHLVQTDAEKIEAVIDTCRQSAMAGTARGMDPVISDRYADSAHKNKTSILGAAERILSRLAFNGIHVKSHEIEVRGRQAQSDLRLRVFLDPQRSEYPLAGGLLLVRLAIGYEQNAEGGWQITRVEIRSVNDTEMGWGDAP